MRARIDGSLQCCGYANHVPWSSSGDAQRHPPTCLLPVPPAHAHAQLVAVKVVDLLPRQRRQLVAAWRECQLLTSLEDDNIVRVHTFHTAQVHRRQNIIEPE